MKRGFFSGFVAVMGLLLLIALFYSHSSRDASVSITDELLIGHSKLNQDWALARNTYSQFASDAMAQQVKDNPNACTIPALTNFQTKVAAYWSTVRAQLLTYGVDCVANMNLSLQNEMGNPSPSVEVKDDTPAYAILTCKRTIGGVENTLAHPFVIWKDITTTVISPTLCQVTVTNELGMGGYPSTPASPVEVSDFFTFT